MSTSPQVYNDISPRTQAYVIAQLLPRGDEEMILEKFGQTYVIPTKSTKTASFRRYEALSLATTALQEGVTPSGTKPTKTDITATLAQYGDFIPFTDVIMDTHEDPLLREYGDLLMTQAAETVETLRYNVMKAGTNVHYANGSARTDVNTPLTTTLQRKATRALKRQRAKHLRKYVSSSANFGTESLERAFIGLVHTDVETDVRNMDGFIPTRKYGTQPVFPNEIGTVEDVRYIRSNMFLPFADGGGAKGAMISTSGTSADVYPVLILAQDCYGIVPLKGKAAMSLIVHNPGKSGSSDPLNQRGTIGWKTMQTSVILNDLWMIRVEVAATN